MPAAQPAEFCRWVVELAGRRGQPIAQLGKDLRIAGSWRRSWRRQADRAEGRRADGLPSGERRELAGLGRRTRVREREHEILRKASGDVAREDVLPT